MKYNERLEIKSDWRYKLNDTCCWRDLNLRRSRTALYTLRPDDRPHRGISRVSLILWVGGHDPKVEELDRVGYRKILVEMVPHALDDMNTIGSLPMAFQPALCGFEPLSTRI